MKIRDVRSATNTIKEYAAVNWNASEFWVDGGCRGNQTHGKREAYGSISDGENVERLQFTNAHTSNEAEYMALSALLGNEAALRLRRTGAKLIQVLRNQIVKQLGH